MKTQTIFIFLICSVLLFANVEFLRAQGKKEAKEETIELSVPDIHCKKCQKKIEKNISYEKGISDLDVDLENKIVKVSYKKDKTTIEKIQEAFKKLGYKTEIVKNKTK